MPPPVQRLALAWQQFEQHCLLWVHGSPSGLQVAAAWAGERVAIDSTASPLSAATARRASRRAAPVGAPGSLEPVSAD